MTSISDIVRKFPWLPIDYRRMRARVSPGDQLYGLEWFDHPITMTHFPTAFCIGRRHGQIIGYDNVDAKPTLCEWGGSQQQVRHRFANMAELIFTQRHPDSDLRPVVRHDLTIPGMAFGAWHDTGTGLVADCILLVDQEQEGLTHLLDRPQADWDFTMVKSDNDSWLSVKRHGNSYALLHARHGSVGDWHPVDRLTALKELSALVPYNDGRYAYCFASMSLTS